MASLIFVPRRSEERGSTDHGCSKSLNTFSFASYQDSGHQKFGPLRVMNENCIEPRTGFGPQYHHELEIFSYIVSGELEHHDSMGNTEILKRGSLQLSSAGIGITHSEKAHGHIPVHFLQIWSLPHTRHLQPKYYTREFSDTQKTNTWVRVVAPAGAEGVSQERECGGPAPVHSALTLYATLLGKKKVLDKALKGKKAYVHVVQTSGYNPGRARGASVRFAGTTNEKHEVFLKEGDGAYLKVGDGQGCHLFIENVGDESAEVLLFDLE